MYLCSVIQLQCMPPYTFPDKYDDLYNCMISGYEKAYDKTIEIGKTDINKDMLYIKFRCTQVPDEEKST